VSEINDNELKKVIGDFIELGHVENIVAMFKQDTSLYRFTGDLLQDERFAVRIGMAVLFEELVTVRPKDVPLAIPYLLPLLQDKTPWVRGEAANLLGIIGNPEALMHLKQLVNDPDPQVSEIVRDALSET
jgi:hypothetical protein